MVGSKSSTCIAARLALSSDASSDALVAAAAPELSSTGGAVDEVLRELQRLSLNESVGGVGAAVRSIPSLSSSKCSGSSPPPAVTPPRPLRTRFRAPDDARDGRVRRVLPGLMKRIEILV